MNNTSKKLAQELINQVIFLSLGSIIFLILIFNDSNWCGLSLSASFITSILSTIAVSLNKIPSVFIPNWRGVEDITLDEQERRDIIIQSQDRRILRYVTSVFIIIFLILFILSYIYNSFLPSGASVEEISFDIFGIFISTFMAVSSTSWLGVYTKMYFKK